MKINKLGLAVVILFVASIPVSSQIVFTEKPDAIDPVKTKVLKSLVSEGYEIVGADNNMLIMQKKTYTYKFLVTTIDPSKTPILLSDQSRQGWEFIGIKVQPIGGSVNVQSGQERFIHQDILIFKKTLIDTRLL